MAKKFKAAHRLESPCNDELARIALRQELVYLSVSFCIHFQLHSPFSMMMNQTRTGLKHLSMYADKNCIIMLFTRLRILAP